MSKSDTRLTAYCGLYCGDCIRYRSEIAELANKTIVIEAKFDQPQTELETVDRTK